MKEERLTKNPRGWKQEQIDCEEHTEIFQASRDWVRKDGTLTGLHLPRGMEGNKKRFSRYIGDKEKKRKFGPAPERNGRSGYLGHGDG